MFATVRVCVPVWLRTKLLGALVLLMVRSGMHCAPGCEPGCGLNNALVWVRPAVPGVARMAPRVANQFKVPPLVLTLAAAPVSSTTPPPPPARSVAIGERES
jgi:hypothetical protein